MNEERLEQIACEFFNITLDDMRSKSPKGEYIVARHIFRVAAIDDFGIRQQRILNLQGIGSNTVRNSIRVIRENKQFPLEYAKFVQYAERIDTQKGIEVVSNKEGIERITNDAFDERFYKHPDKVNPRTGNHFFPAYHFVTSMGSPEDPGLSNWKKDKGHHSDYILERSQLTGSFVHDCIDNMIKHHADITHEFIHKEFPNAKEAQKVKDSLLGFLNFMEEEEPVIIASEQMLCGKDFGFTQDLKCRLKSDDYKHVWTVDWKTSKVASSHHSMQVVVMMKTSGAERCAVVVFGNSTKTKYTKTVVPQNKYDFYMDKFNAIKNTAYIEMLSRGLIKPRESNMPNSFKLKNVKFAQ